MTTLTHDGVGRVTGGVDTHKVVHVAAVIDSVGRLLATAEFTTTSSGYRQLLAWMRSHGELVAVGRGPPSSASAALSGDNDQRSTRSGRRYARGSPGGQPIVNPRPRR
jgi:hypothetical protein